MHLFMTTDKVGGTVCIWYDEYDIGIFAYDERNTSLKVLEFLNIISRYDELSSIVLK